MSMKQRISNGIRFGNLTTEWSYGSGDNKIWKCTCSCGKICYVKERALLNNIVKDCGESLHKTQNKHRKTNTYNNRPIRKFIVVDDYPKHVCLKCGANMPIDSRKVYCDKCKQLKGISKKRRYEHFFTL